MADNYHIRDASGGRKLLRSTDGGSDLHTPHTIIQHPIATTTNVQSLATTNSLNIKASAASLYEISANNLNAAVRFLKLYNIATVPVVGTTVPILTIPIPPGSAICLNFGTVGKRLGSGIGIAITALGPDADTTVIAAGEVKVSLSYN